MGTIEDFVGVPLYTAGQAAPPGHYRRVDGDGDGERIVVLQRIDILPASLDGHVAVYARVPPVPCLTPAPRGQRVTSREGELA